MDIVHLCVMSLSASLTPTGKALSGNPIKLSVSTDGVATYTVAIGGVTVFTGSGTGNFYVFLNDIIAPYVTPQLCSNADARVLIPISGQYADVTVTVTDDASGSAERTLTAYYGGVSKQTWRELGNTNIFTTRFLAQTNFFFTSRGNSEYITMRKSEVSPIPLIVPSGMQAKHGTDSLSISGTQGSFAALNVSRLLANWQSTFGYTPDFLDIYGNGGKACSLQFVSALLSKDRYLVRFVDSLGCYSYVEFCGCARQGIDEVNDGIYGLYDDSTDSYQQLRARTETRGIVSMNTGYKTEEELIYLQELLRSEDVALIGYKGSDRKVTATCDGYEVAIASFEPGNITFDFHFSDLDT